MVAFIAACGRRALVGVANRADVARNGGGVGRCIASMVQPTTAPDATPVCMLDARLLSER